MPGEPEEYLALCRVPLLPGAWSWRDGTEATPAERADAAALRAYHDHLVRRRAVGPQRRGMRLLRSFLSPAQRAMLARRGHFLATCPSGHTYRLTPRRGLAERVTFHGRRWFVSVAYCLHDDGPDRMPPADVTLAHLLLLLSDETGFLLLANASDRRDQLWNGPYRRRLRAARIARAAAARLDPDARDMP